MNLNDIAKQRIASQQLAKPTSKDIHECVKWMGAIQAQDYAMSKWAIGVRLNGVTEKDVEKALDDGDIIRTHVLRPTWHIVAAEDIYWMLKLTSSRIQAVTKGRHRELGLTPDILKKSFDLITHQLADHKHSTRDAIAERLTASAIATDNNRLSHILLEAELEGLICNGGRSENGKTTYALLEERVKKAPELSEDESLKELADRYFISHGPATLNDFIWWSGLSVTSSKKALDNVKHKLVCEQVKKTEYWFDRNAQSAYKPNSLLLPAFDEFLISYKDRNASLKTENQKAAFSNNGIFWPTVVVNGKVTGLWKRSVKKDNVIVSIDLFKNTTASAKTKIKQSAKRLAKFLDKKLIFQE